jgi:hypothetical protein
LLTEKYSAFRKKILMDSEQRSREVARVGLPLREVLEEGQFTETVAERVLLGA